MSNHNNPPPLSVVEIAFISLIGFAILFVNFTKEIKIGADGGGARMYGTGNAQPLQWLQYIFWSRPLGILLVGFSVLVFTKQLKEEKKNISEIGLLELLSEILSEDSLPQVCCFAIVFFIIFFVASIGVKFI